MASAPLESGGIFYSMNVKCDQCQKSGKGRYSSFFVEDEVRTLCDDCRYGRTVIPGKSDKEIFEHLQTPFWKLMGLPPKPEDKKLESYLKSRGMTYGDWRRERDYKAKANQPSALPQFEQHYKKYGRNNAPTKEYEKR